MFTTAINILWGVLSIAAQAIAVVLIVAHLSPRLRSTAFVRVFQDRGIHVAFIVALLAMTGSLIYSNVLGYAPCPLCWYQRIFMYPQVFLMGVALYKKDQGIKLYGFILSFIGAAIALFHYTGQLGLTPLPCSAVGYSVSCSVRFVLEFGYITIPMMAFSAFILIAATLSLSLRNKHSVVHTKL